MVKYSTYKIKIMLPYSKKFYNTFTIINSYQIME